MQVVYRCDVAAWLCGYQCEQKAPATLLPLSASVNNIFASLCSLMVHARAKENPDRSVADIREGLDRLLRRSGSPYWNSPLSAHQPPEILDCPNKAFAQRRFGRPVQRLSGQGDVGLALSRVVRGEGEVDEGGA